MATPLFVLRTLQLVCRRLLRAVTQFVVERIEQDLHQGVRIVALQLVFARLPAAIIADIWAPLRVVKE